MSLKSLMVKSFTVFDEVELKLSPGVNVLIGENGTGKTHLLKLIYCTLLGGSPEQGAFQRGFGDQDWAWLLGAVFLPDERDASRLIRQDRKLTAVGAEYRAGSVHFTLDRRGKTSSTAMERWPLKRPVVYLPSRDLLAIYEGFLSAYDKRELPFDQTYADACLALGLKPLKAPTGASQAVVEALEQTIGGTVIERNGRFYIRRKRRDTEAHLEAEGLRKLGMISYLVRNGSIAKGTLVLWDEPETGINPRFAPTLAQVILKLAEHGVQFVIATHDYLLPQKLSLEKEFSRTKAAMRFFSLYKERDHVSVEDGETVADLRHNPILAEFSAHYEYEHSLLVEEQERHEAGRDA